MVKAGAAVRAGSLHKLTEAGWRSLEAHGIGTIIDLRNANEREAECYMPPSEKLTAIHLPLEEENKPEDSEFWKQWRDFNCSPIYYVPFINQYPERIATTIRVMANAKPGGVLFHCGIGRDRTGLITLILLKLLRATNEEIFQDFALSAERLRPHWEMLGRRNDETNVASLYEKMGTSAAETINATLEAVGQRGQTHAALQDIELQGLRERFLE
jgi:protein tyrosine/serine phosphatase